jgi:hypothetical protein
MPRKRAALVAAGAAAAIAVAAGAAARLAEDRTPSSAAAPIALRPPSYRFPLKASANGRYLVDRRNRPVFLVGDSPQALVGNLSVQDAARFMQDRRRYGIDALWVNLLCAKYTGCRDDGSTWDDIAPFTTTGDLSTPNPAYFRRVDAMLRTASRYGMVVFLDPIETGGWLDTLRRNGVDRAYAYGQFLGKRYRSFPNIVWFNGNDFQSWQSSTDDALVLAVARGIRSVDSAHLQTIELNYYESGSLDDARWRGIAGIDAAYTYKTT